MSEPFTWKAILRTLVKGQALTADESYWFVDELMNGNADPVAVGATLAAMQTLGLTSEEVAGAAKAMVSHAKSLNVEGETTDIVGTGGDGASTVNLSTMGAVVAAAAGVRIVKHGNRAASSKSGTADCLESLGLPLDLEPEAVGEVGDEVGITFAFAKTFHPAMRFVGPVRSALGIPTVFNVLGPLTNPAHPSHVAIGCADRKLSPMMASVFAGNGQSGLVYTSSEGLDEMAPTGPVSVWDVKNGEVTESTFDPTVELGLPRITVEDLRGGEPEFNAQVMRDFVAGKDIPSRSTALLNAASAIVADGHLLSDTDASLTERFKEAYALAQEAIASGAAEDLLKRWIATAQAKVAAE
ncbi:anthranilate phosphoribosyltransferase [Bifidobacterium crudilactis]|jgi:anthranilate phosphoribosyltransferase|uniref:anthranilate phosphoribosyltransferase n=2 Tax=Bifidobacterium crudilactis TaxID=327277 RepID=UPI0005548069|nr:anthranilate phosphoribosyltransferase [Bifidobacterium crudilactis]MCI2148059.1 anthranilate phosphoribosyltransferase [Bifidobacterium crudilactis]MCI2158010.1 anthranilate phosphoribosyltransferase [Bifidobacterium crudilactis]